MRNCFEAGLLGIFGGPEGQTDGGVREAAEGWGEVGVVLEGLEGEFAHEDFCGVGPEVSAVALVGVVGEGGVEVGEGFAVFDGDVAVAGDDFKFATELAVVVLAGLLVVVADGGFFDSAEALDPGGADIVVGAKGFEGEDDVGVGFDATDPGFIGREAFGDSDHGEYGPFGK